MRILSIELGGFLSYSAPQFIDFTRANVFCISGPNGAGKSSILDGIVYALYGKIPRYAGRRINTEEDVINHNSNRLCLSLRFKVGDRIYLVKRELVRGKSQQANIYELIDDKPVPLGVKRNREVNSLIESLLGMDYETFTRTVILPQNQIDRFLKPPSSEAISERRQILQRLLGLDIYKEMKKIAGQRYRDISKELQLITNRLDGELKNYTRDYIRSLEKELKVKEEKLKDLDKERQDTGKDVERLKETINLFTELISSQKNYQVIQSRLDSIRDERKEVDRLEAIYQLQIEAIPLWNMVRDFCDKKSRLDSLEKEKKDIEARIKKSLEDLEFEEKKAKEYLRHIEYAEKLLGFTPLAEAIRNLEADRKRIDKTREEIEKRERDLSLIGSEIDTIDQEIIDWELKISQLKSRLGERNKVWEELKGLIEDIKILKSVEKELNDHYERKKKLERDKSELEKSLETIEKTMGNLSKELEEMERVIEDSHLQKIIDSLSIGDKCPICGSTIEKLPERPGKFENLEELLTQYQRKKEFWQKSFGDFSISKTKLQDITEEENSLSETIKRLEKEREEKRSSACRLLERYFGTDYVLDEVFINSAIEKERRDIETQLNTLEKEKEIKAIQLKEKRSLYEKEETAIISFRTQLEIEEKELNKRERDLLEKVSETGIEWKDFLARNFLKEAQDIKDKYQRLLDSSNKTISGYKISIESGRARIQQIDTETKEIRERLVSLKKEIDETREDIELRCQSLGITLKELERFKIDKAYIERVKREFDELIAKQNLLKDHISKLRETLIRLGIDPDKPEGLKLLEDSYNSKLTSLKNIEERIGVLSREVGSLEAQLKSAREYLALAESLSEKKKELERKLNLYRVVDDALSENRFPEFLMREAMENIIDRASVQLSFLTQGRYSFSLASDDSADIVVNDNWYPAQKRKTYSLSGGESFLASIALAIAIAEEIRGKKSVDCLFIDEGFGSLDDTGLDTIVSALAELENSGIMIGVITHNKELASRFPYRIEVEKDERGSRIKGEW